MTKDEAKKQLFQGYLFLFAGIIFGVLVYESTKQSITISALVFGYFLWATYWGYVIMYRKFSVLFSAPIHIGAKNMFDYFFKHILFKFTSEFLKFWICYFVGALGGGIFKQIQLSKNAYF